MTGKWTRQYSEDEGSSGYVDEKKEEQVPGVRYGVPGIRG
jgi:hypothetical protein